MIKIALLTTCELTRDHFADKIQLEFEERDKEVVQLTKTADQSPFIGNLEYLEQHMLWAYASQMQKELQAEISYDVAICKATILDPFIYANVYGIKLEKLSACASAALQWMRTYDTIVYLKNSDMNAAVLFPTDFVEVIEAEYEKWAHDHKSTHPISIIESKNVYLEKGKWVI